METTVSNLVNHFLTNGDQSMKYLYDRNGTQVLYHDQYPDFVIKISHKRKVDSDFQQSLLEQVPSYINNFSRIRYNQGYRLGNQDMTLEVIDFLKGTPLHTYNQQQVHAAIKGIRLLHTSINESSNDTLEELPTLQSIFFGIILGSSSSAVASIGHQLLQQKPFKYYLESNHAYVTIADLVTENILFDRDNNVNFIDLDPFILGPQNLQIAILLSSNILLQDQYIDVLSMEAINNLYRIWGVDTLELHDIFSLMMFPLLMLGMRNVDIARINRNQNPLYYKLSLLLEFLLEVAAQFHTS
jgi:hypothetical protein